jgi:mono/diheme cytochrome c family protein
MTRVHKSIELVSVIGMLTMAVFASLFVFLFSTAAHADGRELFDQLCASCHGVDGSGDGAVSSDVLLRPRDFSLNAFKFDTDADWQKGTDADLANVVKNGTAAYGGSSQMPAWGTLSEDDIATLVAHIRALQKKRGG